MAGLGVWGHAEAFQSEDGDGLFEGWHYFVGSDGHACRIQRAKADANDCVGCVKIGFDKTDSGLPRSLGQDCPGVLRALRACGRISRRSMLSRQFVLFRAEGAVVCCLCMFSETTRLSTNTK